MQYYGCQPVDEVSRLWRAGEARKGKAYLERSGLQKKIRVMKSITKLLLMLLVFGLAVGAAQANMLANPGFEDGTFTGALDNFPPDWSFDYPSYTSAYTWLSGTDAHSGTKYMRIQPWYVSPSYNAYAYQPVTGVIAGRDYEFSVWSKNEVEGATNQEIFNIQWSGAAGFISSVDEYIDVTSTEWTQLDFGTFTAPEGAIAASIWIGVNGYNPSATNIDDAFMGALPPQASDPNPADGALGVSANAGLSWASDEGVDSSNVYFGTDPTPDSGEFQVNQSETTFDPGTMALGTYYWRIDQINSLSTTTGVVWSFTVGPPGKAFDPNPVDGALGISANADLSWAFDEGADSSNVYFGTDPTPDSAEFQVNQSETTFDPGTMDAETTYYWRIDQINSQGTTTGDVWSFTTRPIIVFQLAGDLNRDWKVDFLDLAIFAEQWLDLPGCTGHPDDCADLADDDGVNLADYPLLSGNYGKSSLPLILKINELSAINSSIITDEAGDFDDWIEIYNALDEPFDIGGLYLSDSPGDLTKWRIPSDNPSVTTIAANGYLLIWADNEPLEGPLHATFQLAADGDEVILYDDDSKIIIDRIDYDEQIVDITFGCYPDGTDNWEFFDDPTPTAQNISGYPGRAAVPDFSKERSFCTSSFSLTITSDTPGAQIYYSTNANDPYPGNPGVSLYTGPIPISSTTTIKAAAFKTDLLPSRIVTHTYIYVDDVIAHPDMSTDITEDPVWGPQMHDALLEIPTISLVTEHTIPNYPIESPPEVAVSIEMIFPDGRKGFQANAGVERFGGQYTVWPKQALRVSFKSIYGPSRLKFDLFDDTP